MVLPQRIKGSSTENIEISAKNITINAEENINIGAQGNIEIATQGDLNNIALFLTHRVKEGVDYIDAELEKENPVLVGLNHTVNYRHNGEIINAVSSLGDPGTTDHYVVIVGRGCENDKVYYRFYEVGISWAHYGQHSSNKLFLGDDFSLKGTPAHNKEKKYTVSQVRKN